MGSCGGVTQRRVMKLGKIPKWSCATCGMSSSRGDSVRRHVRNLHKDANIVPFSAYVAGVNWGFYYPRPAPNFGKKREVGTFTKDPMTEEFRCQIARAAARQYFPDANDRLASALSPSPIPQNAPSVSGLSLPERFGYRVYFCEKCQMLSYTMVCFPREPNSLGRTFVPSCIHGASGSRALPAGEDKTRKLDMAKRIEEQRETQLPPYLCDIIRNAFPKPCINAIRIDSASNGLVSIKSDVDSSISIVFNSHHESISEYYYPLREEKPYTYTPALMGNAHSASRTIIRSNWLERAARNGVTVLDDNEIANAAYFFLDSTFGFIRLNAIESNVAISSSSLFFVYISSSPPEKPSNTKSIISTLLGSIESKGPGIADSRTKHVYNSIPLVTA